MAKLSDVFGVSSKPVLSYVERDEVDSRFREAIASDKQVVVYGSSKQGNDLPSFPSIYPMRKTF
jgi:hypothetical protein